MNMRRHYCFAVGMVLFIFMTRPLACLFAADNEEAGTKKVSAQQVGGLLFDVDEGVDIQKGPGGSVYLKSNREFMKNTLESLESRIQTLEEKVKKLESGKTVKPAETKSSAGTSSDTESSSKTRVLVN